MIVELTRTEKILLAMLELTQGKLEQQKYEDIVVAVYEKYPDNFHLKGYPQYPDSGDIIHKPLYDLKKKGLITAYNKFFSFTPLGLKIAEELRDKLKGKNVKHSDRHDRLIQNEINRLMSLEGFKLFIDNKTDQIVESDFYNYFAATPRMNKNEFLSKMNTLNRVEEMIRKAKENKEINKKILEYSKFLRTEYKDIINYMGK